MAIKLTFNNALQLTSLISPIFIVFFLVMISIVNQNIKGLIYLAGVLMTSVMNVFLMNLLKIPVHEDSPLTCNLVELPFLNEYSSPAPSCVVLAFTMVYLLQPLFMNHGIFSNVPLVLALTSLLGLDIMTKIFNKCTTPTGAFAGTTFGMFCGIIWYNLFKISGYDSLLYFDELDSNNVHCSRPSKQTFKCSVYKNGQLLSSHSA